jgi:fructoselysine-6-P-deglycase FrlB-like protein
MHTDTAPVDHGRQANDIRPAFVERPEERERLYAVATEAVAGGTTDIFFVGAGGSLAASYPASLMLQEQATRLGAYHVQSDEFNSRPPRRLGSGSLVVVASRTGTTPETVRAIETARRAGAGR